MRHGRVYEIVYLSGESRNEATKNLQEALVDLYTRLMELLAHAFKRLKEGQGKQFLRALVSGGEGAKLISALTEEEHKVSMAAQGCGAVASQEHQMLLKSLHEPIRNIEDTVKRLLQKVEDGTLENALEYISTIPIGEHQQEKRETRTTGTCEWLLNHSRFVKWERSRYSSILWLQGSGMYSTPFTLNLRTTETERDKLTFLASFYSSWCREVIPYLQSNRLLPSCHPSAESRI